MFEFRRTLGPRPLQPLKPGDPGVYTAPIDILDTLPDGRLIQLLAQGQSIPMAEAIARGYAKAPEPEPEETSKPKPGPQETSKPKPGPQETKEPEGKTPRPGRRNTSRHARAK